MNERMKRREALARLATAAAGTAAAPHLVTTAAAAPPAPARPPLDPDLQNPEVPWARVLTAEERNTLGALCDLMLPADARSPSASALGVPAFIDEWVSAPYPTQQADQLTVRGGLAWLNTESSKRFGRGFAALTAVQQRQLCDDIADPRRTEVSARGRLRAPAAFFARTKQLAIEGFYTTALGMKDIGYVGNVPRASFDGPPPEVLAHL